MTWLTGGADGFQGMNIGPIFTKIPFGFDGVTGAYYTLAVLVIGVLILRRIMHSSFGASLKAIRDNRLRAAAVGINVNRRIIMAYTLAGTFAAIAGAVRSQGMDFVSLDVFAFETSADALLMVVIGGTGWLYGGFIGAAVFSGLHQMLSDWSPQYWTFWVGIFLIVLMRVGRDRLLRPWQWFKGGRHD
jgi:branched-chain amino acid transport system permease protein